MSEPMDHTADTPDTAEQDHLLTYWLRLVDGLITAQIGESLEEHGLTRTQWMLMNALTQRPHTMAELHRAAPPAAASEAHDPDGPQTVEEHLEELVDSGWLVYEGELYTLTSTGRVSGERVAHVVKELRAQVTEGLDEGEFDAVLAALQKMARNLGWSENTEG
ncbi:MarR family transcriptional regulator [Micrococcus terreus]|uniref:MarR family winged helix-turn-helix transcriptional regulator n=1 Tax=Micrococcus terreus TaxID=574650 RepID=UPI00301598AA